MIWAAGGRIIGRFGRLGSKLLVDLKLLIDLGRGGAIYWSIWPSGEQIIDRFGPRGGELLVDLAVWERIIGRSGRLGSELLVDLVVGEPNGAQSPNGAQIQKQAKIRNFEKRYKTRVKMRKRIVKKKRKFKKCYKTRVKMRKRRQNGAQIGSKVVPHWDLDRAFGGHFSLKNKRFARYCRQNMSFSPF